MFDAAQGERVKIAAQREQLRALARDAAGLRDAWNRLPEATRIKRIRQTVDLAGHRTAIDDVITLDRVDAAGVAEEAAALGYRALEPRHVPATDEYVGSEVVMLCRS